MTGRDAGARYDRDHVGVIRKIRFFIVLVLLLTAVYLLVIGTAVVRDADMEPSYRAGQLVFFLRPGDINRGDVAVLGVDVRGTVLRRVVAVPGDTVELRDGTVFVNGLAERGNYNITRTDPVAGGPGYPLLLRQGEYFVLGDRRETALDSRSFGLVTSKNILGRVL